MVAKKRNYAKENKWESSPEQVARRVARNRVRREAIKRHGKAALAGKEVDHVGSHRKGSLDNVPTRIISKTANRKKQPKRS
jgi:hypothetical protein